MVFNLNSTKCDFFLAIGKGKNKELPDDNKVAWGGDCVEGMSAIFQNRTDAACESMPPPSSGIGTGVPSEAVPDPVALRQAVEGCALPTLQTAVAAVACYQTALCLALKEVSRDQHDRLLAVL